MSNSTKKPIKPAVPKLPATIVQTEWKKGEIRFSKKWAASKTGKEGSAYYFIPTGQKDESSFSFKTDDGATKQFGITRNFFAKPEERDNLPVIQFDGGRPVFDKLEKEMPVLYINCNKDYKGFFYMSPERFQRYIDEGKVVLSNTDMASVDTSVPN